MRRGGYKCRTLNMHVQLKDQQLKTMWYIYRLLYQNFRVTANQKATNDMQTKKNQLKYCTKVSHQTTRRDNKITKEEKKEQEKQIQSN